MNLKLSIIVPFYGTADKQLLNRCLESIHGQGVDKREYEIILADNGGSGFGLGAARNNGIEQAQGEYLFFMDADDYLFPHTLRHCLCKLKEQSPDMLSFGFEYVSAAGAVPRHPKDDFVSYSSGARYMELNNFQGTAWRHFIRRELIEKHHLRFVDCYVEDEEFVAKLYFHADRVIITKCPVYAYYQNPHSITSWPTETLRLKHRSDFWEMLIRLQSYLATQELASPLQRRGLERRIHFLTIDYVRQIEWKRSSIRTIRQEFRELWRNNFLPLPRKGYSWKYALVRPVLNLTRLL